ncbi:MAG: DNA-directed RNA polymerase subunit alpha [Verrucomicrobia bacterium]|nr:DNA-directed RNA polymerase subunit alpha [Verrucomicrobiota bacterium]
MSVLYGKFEMPQTIKVEEDSSTFARFIAEPFERGFGHTMGNSLRRILLSSIEAPACVGIRIEGFLHEYMAVEGIVEDGTDIVLNLKNALIRCVPTDDSGMARSQKVITTDVDVTPEMLHSTQYSVRLKDLVKNTDFEVVNPELHLFSITKPMKVRVELRIAYGRGYIPSERLVIRDKMVNEIIIDGIFSPVRMVNYRVENTRVGQDTDYDKLILEVKTDGRSSPREALSFAAQIALQHLSPFGKVEEKQIVCEEEQRATNTDREALLGKLSQRINEIELSVRSTNCLDHAGIRYIGELVVMRENDMLSFRNFGKKSLGEIREKLTEMGLGFNQADRMAEYGITSKNIVQMIEDYLQQRAEAASEAQPPESPMKGE